MENAVWIQGLYGRALSEKEIDDLDQFGVTVGKGVVLDIYFLSCAPGVTIGNGVKITGIRSLKLEAGVEIANGAKIIAKDDDRCPIELYIKPGVLIGRGATVICDRIEDPSCRSRRYKGVLNNDIPSSSTQNLSLEQS